MLYRIAAVAILTYLLAFVSASLLFMAAFFTATVAGAILPTGVARAATVPVRRPAAAVRKEAAIVSPLTLKTGAKRRVSVALGSPRGWDRNLNARPSRGAYRRSFRVTATAYTPINTRMEGGRYTFTERDGRAAHGIAVDPDLIPIGSRLWIPGYGHAIADDTGGRIRGHHVDVRIQDYDRMLDWGRRDVRIYLLSDGSERPRKRQKARASRARASRRT
ncbi:MAG: 3D domain-containing protein [Cytophagales bacterium]|nr:3D domain-containing protein [Armatimonadota bacterium]